MSVAFYVGWGLASSSIVSAAVGYARARTRRPAIEIYAISTPVTVLAMNLRLAHLAVRNVPLGGIIGDFVDRASAVDATVGLTWRRDGITVIPRYDGRWSDQPEPTDTVTMIASRKLTLAPSRNSSLIPVAIQRDDGSLSAFGPESYCFADFDRAEWRLDPAGTYDVEVEVAFGAQVTSARFRLVAESTGTGAFRFEQVNG